MPKAPSTRAGANARRQVWDAAIRLFATKGFHGVGIRELAEGAGMSSATLYHYMGTKEELLASIMRASLDRLNDAAERVVADAPDPQSQIIRLVHVHVLTHALRPEETAVVDNELEALGPERRTAMVALRDAYEDHWRRAIANGCASGLFTVPDRTFARMALLEMCSAVAKWYSPTARSRSTGWRRHTRAWRYSCSASRRTRCRVPRPPRSTRRGRWWRRSGRSAWARARPPRPDAPLAAPLSPRPAHGGVRPSPPLTPPPFQTP